MAGRAEPGHFRVVFRDDLSFCLLQGFPSKACRWSLAIQSHLEFRSLAQPGACPTARPSLLPRGFPLGTSPGALCHRSVSAVGASWHILSLPAGTSQPAPPQLHQPSGSHGQGTPGGLMLLESTAGVRMAPKGTRSSWAPVKAKAAFGVRAESSGLVSAFPSSGHVPIPKMPGHCLCGGEGQILAPQSSPDHGRAQLGGEGSWSSSAAGEEELPHGASPGARVRTGQAWCGTPGCPGSSGGQCPSGRGH